MKTKRFVSIAYILIFSMLFMIINPVQTFAINANKSVATTSPVENIIATDHFYSSNSRNDDIRYLKLCVMLGDTYREEYSYAEGEAVTRVSYVDIPFVSTWSIGFEESFVYVGPLAIDFCNLDNNTLCSNSSCGSYCTNFTYSLIHHKNSIKNLDKLKSEISDDGYDIMMALVSTPMCGIWDSHSTGILGVTYPNDNYTLLSNRPSASTTLRVRIMQHEISHMFGCSDGKCTPDRPCIMNGGYDAISLYISNVWCSECIHYFDPYTH